MTKEITIKGNKLFLLIHNRFDTQQIDVTPLFNWFKEFQDWKEAGMPMPPPLKQ